MLIEIHMLQNHAPSNLNRDDTGSPKDALFGGVKRCRISSQCLKRSIRTSTTFEMEMKDSIGIRTRRLPDLVYKKLMEQHQVDEPIARSLAEKFTAIAKGEKADGKKPKKTKEGEGIQLETQLIFFDQSELDSIVAKSAELAKSSDLEKMKGIDVAKELEQIMKNVKPRSVDIAMFGRMTTGDFIEDVEASVQVAHAIGCSRMENEYDFFTAVDDLNKGDSMEEHGAGHIGDVEFSSTTFYKYFAIDFDELVKNLGGDTPLALRAIAALIKAAVLSNPSGKQNTFAAHNPPELIRVELKETKIPISYANAFIKPVEPSYKNSLVENSATAFKSYVDKINQVYGLVSQSWYLSLLDEFEMNGTKCNTLDDLVKTLTDALSQSKGV